MLIILILTLTSQYRQAFVLIQKLNSFFIIKKDYHFTQDFVILLKEVIAATVDDAQYYSIKADNKYRHHCLRHLAYHRHQKNINQIPVLPNPE